MRDRAWRRHMQEKIVKRRIKNINNSTDWWYSGYDDVNGINRQHPKLADYIGGSHYKMFKSYTTTRCDSKHKTKYSPNKGKCYWRGNEKKGMREYDKREFLKILKENGLR